MPRTIWKELGWNEISLLASLNFPADLLNLLLLLLPGHLPVSDYASMPGQAVEGAGRVGQQLLGGAQLSHLAPAFDQG